MSRSLPEKAPKLKCCDSRPKCKRCPLRYLKDGQMPEELTVKRRKVLDRKGKEVKKKDLDRLWRKLLKRSR